MNLLTAQGAVKALRDKTTLNAAYASYDAGHDDKHRQGSAAYGYNFESASGDRIAGFYQMETLVADPLGPIRKETTVWGKTTVATYSAASSDLSKDDEKRMLLAAFAANGGYYVHPNPRRFHFATFIPAGFKGFVFSGGGRVFPKKPEATTAMVIVVQTGGANLQLITHYPEFMAEVQKMAKLA